MDQSQKVTQINKHEDQFEYLGRWVDKLTFRAFVYNKHGEDKLANNHKEFETLLASGEWFATKKETSVPKQEKKNGIIRANS